MAKHQVGCRRGAMSSVRRSYMLVPVLRIGQQITVGLYHAPGHARPIGGRLDDITAPDNG